MHSASIKFLQMIQSSDLKDEFAMLQSQDILPVHAPDVGGLWETSIKAMKQNLRKIMKKHILLIEHFTTLITEIECMLNSRPLTAFSTDPNDLNALTPGHFFNGSPINLIPDLNSKKTSRLGNLKVFSKCRLQENSFGKNGNEITLPLYNLKKMVEQ